MTTPPPQIQHTTLPPLEIPRASSLDDFLKRVEEAGRPVAYRLKEDERFPAFAKWTEHHFSNSSIPVTAHYCTSERLFDVANASIWQLAVSAIKHETTLGDYVRSLQAHRRSKAGSVYSPLGSQILSGTEMYLRRQYEDQDQWKPLLKDMESFQKFLPVPADDIRTVGFWISGGGISSQMHFDSDGDHNMNFQIQGRKLMTLYEPMDGLQNLYPLPGRGSALSLVDPYRPKTLKRFPRVVHTQPHVMELRAGEVLFIPKQWWHDVRHLGDWNVNVTAWYQRGRRKTRDKREGAWLAGTWRDTLVAWGYVGKLLVVAAVVASMLLVRQFSRQRRTPKKDT